MQQQKAIFNGALKISPAVDLKFMSRQMGHFLLTSTSAESLSVSSIHPDAKKEYESSAFLKVLECLSWDLIWEQLVAVKFEVIENTTKTITDDAGLQRIEIDIHDRMLSNPPGPTAGVQAYKNFDLLQRIRDHIVAEHLTKVNQSKGTSLSVNAAILVAVEHFIKGVVNQLYALAEFYSVYETIAHQWPGGKSGLTKHITKTKIEKITKVANNGQLDLRHPPQDPTAIAALPANAFEDAAAVAKEIIVEYVKGIV